MSGASKRGFIGGLIDGVKGWMGYGSGYGSGSDQSCGVDIRSLNVYDQLMWDAVDYVSDGGDILWERCSGFKDLKRIYRMCTPLSSVIGNKSRAFGSGDIQFLNANTGNVVRGSSNKAWVDLFNRPNPLQSKRRFLMQMYSYVQTYGKSIILKQYAAGYRDVPYRLWVLPMEYLEFDVWDRPIYELRDEDYLNNVWFVFGNERTKLRREDLMMVSDIFPVIDNKTLLPMSRVELLSQPITVILAAIEAEVTMIKKRGAFGLLVNRTRDINGSIVMTEPEKEALQMDFQRKYGLTRRQAQVIISPFDLDWIPMTFPTRELMLHESYVKSYKDVCEAYGYPWSLVAHTDSAAYNNMKTSDLVLYENTIIPEATDIAEQLVHGLGLNDVGIMIKFDYSNNAAFAQSEKDKGDGLRSLNQAYQIEWDAGLITKNMWLEGLGEDKRTEPEFNMYKPEYDKYIFDTYGGIGTAGYDKLRRDPYNAPADPLAKDRRIESGKPAATATPSGGAGA